MKKLLRPNILPYFTLGAGGLGLTLQIWLLTTGVDNRGLFLSTHPAGILLLALTALILIVLAVLAWNFREGKLPRSTHVACALGNAAAAVGILFTALRERSSRQDTLFMICCVFGVLTACALIYAAVVYLRRRRPSFLVYFLATVYLMLHLLCQYRLWSTKSQLFSYCFPLLAAVCLMLTFYHRAALEIRDGSLRQYLFFSQAALYFFCLCLGSGDWIFSLCMGIWIVVNTTPRISYKAGRKSVPAGMQLPETVQECINLLERAGFSTYVVGGCVRDALLGIQPHDYDLCTAATPDQIGQVFQNLPLVHSGEKHGTVGVVIGNTVYEITTFRTEGQYTDGRRPDRVEFVDNIEDDLKRRDFTVCAMAYSPIRGFVDPWGGQTDLKNRILRAVGDPAARFREDALRILRGVRFAVCYHLTPDTDTETAMTQLAPLMDNLARERVFDELCRILPLITAKELKQYAPILLQVIPELAPTLDFDQHSPHHAYDVFTHIALVTEAVGPELALRWAALLHDVGKPSTFTADDSGRGHFYGHADISAQMAAEILTRLKAPTKLREQVVFLIRHHMTPLATDKAALRRQLGKYGETAVRRLLALQKADFSGKALGDHDDGSFFTELETALEEVLREEARLTVRDLAISGYDLLNLGFPRGPLIGNCLQNLLRRVQEDTLPNTREALLEAAVQFREQKEDIL